MGDETKASDPELARTRIDLGEDLLEKTAVLRHTSVEAPKKVVSIAELLQNAKIFLSEGFTEDSKKALHQVLIQDPGNASARKSLNEIHDLELRQIFGQEPVRRPANKSEPETGLQFNVESLLFKLDQDLNLGLSDTVPLFENEDLLQDFCKKLEQDLSRSGALPRDWLDLGIAFFEMDLFAVAERLFSNAIRRLDPQTEAENRQLFIAAHCLLSLSLLVSDRPYDVIRQIQPLIRDSELHSGEKTELFYLMGRAYESIQKIDLAYYYYQQVAQVDPHYRDIESRKKLV